jgi:hypothetical protein
VLVRPDGSVARHRDERVALTNDGVWFINPGSVGEPRDPDARASYAILEWTETPSVTFHRVAYDAARVAQDNLRRLPPLDTSMHQPGVFARLRAHAHSVAHAAQEFGATP